MSILVYNPNSSASMTDSVAEALSHSLGDSSNKINIVFGTGPADSPAEIYDEETAAQSTERCWRVLGDSRNPLYYGNFQGIVIACFSDHPLVGKIKGEAGFAPPVCSILEASILYLDLFGSEGGTLRPPFSIVTSSKQWIEPLDDFLRGVIGPEKKHRWSPTVACGINPLELTEKADHVAEVIRDENLEVHGSRTVILGCAGYCGIRDQLQTKLPAEMTLIEPCKVAVEFVLAGARINESLGLGRRRRR